MVSRQANPQDVRTQIAAAGFEIVEAPSERPGLVGVKKYNCLQYLERNSEGAWVPSGPPYFIVRGVNCELEDRGYQKFWYADGKRFPIRLADLKALHRFDEEVRAILRLKSLYNEALGSTSARTVYDRLTGRPDK
jgi:hypothetical protein